VAGELRQSAADEDAVFDQTPTGETIMSNRPTELTAALHDYLQAHGVREPAALRRLREATADHEWAIMQITPEQGALMALLIELTGATRALEVGVFTGYSALAVALAMGPEGRLVALDRNAEWTEMAQRHWAEAGVADRIDLRLGDATESLEALRAEGLEQTFDFAFIDADKAQYDAYYEHCLALARPGGLIGLDNTFHMGKVADHAKWGESTPAVDALNKKIAADERVSIVMLPVGDGLTLCRKRP
jgi:predicted O-methyltransferase YrrM